MSLLRLRPSRPALTAAVLLAGSVVSSAAAPAGAVSTLPADCGVLDLTAPASTAVVVERAAGADDVFVGTVERAVGPTPAGAGATVLVRVVVTTPLAGDLVRGKPVEVLLTAPAAAPAAAPPVLTAAQPYLFWADRGESTLVADGCAGWTSAAALDAVRLTALQQALAGAAEERSEVALEVPPGGAGSAPELGRLLAPGGAFALVGVLGLALLGRVGRRRD